MHWDLRTKVSQDRPSPPSSQCPTVWAHTVPMCPACHPQRPVPLPECPPSQQLNSSCSSFKPQVNHHLFCKAFLISQAEFNTSLFFLKKSKLGLGITCPVPSRTSFPFQNLCSLALHLEHTSRPVLQPWRTAAGTQVGLGGSGAVADGRGGWMETDLSLFASSGSPRDQSEKVPNVR